MDTELRKIQRHNRILWIILGLLFLLTLGGIFIDYTKKPNTKVENFAGQKGDPGLPGIGMQGPQGVAGYTPVKGVDYTDGAQGVQGIPGPQGIQGPVGPIGPQGIQGDQGPPGADGQPGQSPEFRCNPKNHDYEWRYVGDDTWQVLQKDSQACTSAAP